MGLPFSFIPYNDNNPVRYRTLPWGTLALILVNTVIHLALFRYHIIDKIMVWQVYGTVPVHHVESWGMPGLSSVTAMFLHGDFLHLFFNMMFLWAFGRRVEDACGTFRFLAFYLTAGIMGDILTVGAFDLSMTSDGTIPGIGASGAIAGVMGAYMVLFPGTRISGIVVIYPGFCLIPVPYRVRLPAVIPLLWFLIEQVYYSFQVVTIEDPNYGIGFLAHLGGFISGILIFLYLRKDVFYRYWTPADL